VQTAIDTDAIRKNNHDQLVAYYRSGIAQPGSPKRLGVEIEHFIVTDDGNAPVCYEGRDGIIGVQDILHHLQAFYPQATFGSHGELLGLANETGSITLEPAAQLEISIAPYERVRDVETAYRAFRNALDPFLSQHGCHAASYGYHPSARALELPLIPKERYALMDAYFARLGTHGARMMRASASTQVSIDYYSEEDAVRKLRVATALGPVLAYISDNCPVFEGYPNTEPLARMNLWRDVDKARCESIPGVFDEGFGFAACADWLLRTPPIFITRPAANAPDGPALRLFGDMPAADAYADAPMEKSDIEHLISMFWPDVRLKRFVEIRQGDSLPANEAYGYAALIKGLFYAEESLSAIEAALGVRDGIWPQDDTSVNAALAEIRTHGENAWLCGMELSRWVELLFDAAAAALPPDEVKYLHALRHRTRR